MYISAVKIKRTNVIFLKLSFTIFITTIYRIVTKTRGAPVLSFLSLSICEIREAKFWYHIPKLCIQKYEI